MTADRLIRFSSCTIKIDEVTTTDKPCYLFARSFTVSVNGKGIVSTYAPANGVACCVSESKRLYIFTSTYITSQRTATLLAISMLLHRFTSTYMPAYLGTVRFAFSVRIVRITSVNTS